MVGFITFGFQLLQVEVHAREGRRVNIDMVCGRIAGLLLSTLGALENLGMDIQQVVRSCFNGFALDVFRAQVLLYSFSDIAKWTCYVR